MKAILIIGFVFSLVVFCNSCREASSDVLEAEQIVGRWYLELEESDTIRFTPDGYYYDSKFNSTSDSLKGFVQKLNGEIEEVNYGKLKYRAIHNPDEIITMSIYGESNDLEFMRKAYILQENSLIEIKYKRGSAALSDDIQIAQRYFRVGSNREFEKTRDSLHLYIPANCNEDLLSLAFSKNELKSSGGIKVMLDSNGLVEVPYKEDVRMILDGAIASYIIDSSNKPRKIHTFQWSDWNKMVEIWTNKDYNIDDLPVPLDSTIVIPSARFNPSRSYVHELFGRKIDGNVATFKYTTLRKEMATLGI